MDASFNIAFWSKKSLDDCKKFVNAFDKNVAAAIQVTKHSDALSEGLEFFKVKKNKNKSIELTRSETIRNQCIL